MTDRDHHLHDLKAAADPRRIAAALGLRGQGKRFFCPTCQPDGGKTPDLAVLDRGFYCHKGGHHMDVFELVMNAGNMDFHNAVLWLEGETGIGPPDRQRGGYGDRGAPPIARPGASGGPSAHASAARKPTAGKDMPIGTSGIYSAFLTACRPVEGRALDFLTTDKGIAAEVIAAMGIRFCGREYHDVMTELKTTFGDAALLDAGLLKKAVKGDRLVPTFWHYYAKKAGFLVIPYFQDGQPVYLKARPPLSKAEAERRELVRFMNTGGPIPCLYNVDVLKSKPDRIFICEGESDTWTALSYGVAAVGSPGAHNFKAEWAGLFRDFQKGGRSTVFLVMDADAAGEEGSRTIADPFLKADLPVPLKIVLPPGQDLNQYMAQGDQGGGKT